MIFYINENVLFNEKDIYYNKDKFDNGDINLCFITGHSGSGKSTMGRNMSKNNIQHYELDDLMFTKDHFNMNELKEYGNLIYSYFNGPGKKYYISLNDYKNMDDKSAIDYENNIFTDFVHYAMKYTKSHKDKKFVIEGVWLFRKSTNGTPWFNPEEFKDYAFYIKGTSMLISKIRAAKRDSQDGETNIQKVKSFIKLSTHAWKYARIDESSINRFRKYFINLMKKEDK